MTHMVSPEESLRLIERQKRYEIHCIDEGIKRFRLNELGGKLKDDGSLSRKDLADRQAVRVLYQDILPGLTARVTKMRDEAAQYAYEPPRGGRFDWGSLPLAVLHPEQTAVITLRGVLSDEYSDRALAKKLTSASLKVGSMMFTQLEFEDWKARENEREKEEEDYRSRYKQLVTFLKGQPVTQKNFARFMTKFEQVRLKKDRNAMISLGTRLVHALIEEGRGWFEVGSIYSKGTSTKVIKFSDEALAALKDQREHAELQKPMLRPMLCPPKPWRRAINDNRNITVPISFTFRKENQDEMCPLNRIS